MTDIEIVDATEFSASLVVVGQSAEAEGVVLVSVDGATSEEAGRFANNEYGTIPQGVAGFGDRLVVISEIYGNDVEFYASNNSRTRIAGHPSAVFDDGESARDIACSEEVCVGVGFADATYRQDLDANTGIAGVSESGSDYQVLDHRFDTESLDAVAWSPAGFLAVANSPDNQGLAWQSPDGTEWNPIAAPFAEMIVDGVAAVDGSYVVFGRNPRTGDVMVWTSDDTTEWSESVVATGRPEDSQIRSVISTQSGLIAAGIDGATFDVLVWASADGADWQEIATLPRR